VATGSGYQLCIGRSSCGASSFFHIFRRRKKGRIDSDFINPFLYSAFFTEKTPFDVSPTSPDHDVTKRKVKVIILPDLKKAESMMFPIEDRRLSLRLRQDFATGRMTRKDPEYFRSVIRTAHLT